MKELVVYGTTGCHLCEEAETLLHQVYEQREKAFNWKIVDIINDAELLERYEIIIPVIQNAVSKRELKWPFSYADLVDFISETE